MNMLLVFVPGRGYTQEDWDEVSDNPEITEEQWAKARPLAETRPELVAASRRGRGNPRLPTKDLVSLRLDKDVLCHAARRRIGVAEPGKRYAAKRAGPGWHGKGGEVTLKIDQGRWAAAGGPSGGSS